MTTRDDILKVAIESGWHEFGNPHNPGLLRLAWGPASDPSDRRRVMEVCFSAAGRRVTECWIGIAVPCGRLTGGVKAIKQHLRESRA